MNGVRVKGIGGDHTPMHHQERVAGFLDEHDLDAPLAYRLLDLSSEVGELAKEATTSTDYGADPAAIDLAADEVGDALFALLAVAEAADVDAETALEEAMTKYERRLSETGDPGSGDPVSSDPGSEPGS